MIMKRLIEYMFLLLLATAAWKDIHTRRIPNVIVLGIAAAGIFSIPFFPAISLADRGIGIFGGGDIKLMAASGIFLGREANLEAFALAVFLAGGYCIWMLLRKKLSRRERIAFGPFLCAGIIAKMLIAL